LISWCFVSRADFVVFFELVSIGAAAQLCVIRKSCAAIRPRFLLFRAGLLARGSLCTLAPIDERRKSRDIPSI
jgi:hypothetical protein